MPNIRLTVYTFVKNNEYNIPSKLGYATLAYSTITIITAAATCAYFFWLLQR
jgi:hypothetical protein